MNRYKSGFTLSEILITLGVIGVVAAITMPVITTSIKKTVLKNQFKKFYSTMNNALSKTFYEMGDTECYYFYKEKTLNKIVTTGCDKFYEELMKNLKVLKYCENNALANGCIKDYNFGNASSGCAGYNNEYINNKNHTIVLNDGSIISIFGGTNYPTFMFDVNGQKGPNLIGQDVFSLPINVDGNNVPRLNATDQAQNQSVIGCLNHAHKHKYYFSTLYDIMNY